MWWYLIPVLTIVYLGMAFISGPIFVYFTEQPDLDEGTFIGYTVAAVFWPVCLTLCLLYCGVAATGGLWMKYVKFLESYYKRTQKDQSEQKIIRDYY